MKNISADFIKPAELITLPNEINHHDHSYNQIVIGLKGRSEFNIEGLGSIIVPGQGCAVTASSDHAFNGIGDSQILVLNLPGEENLDFDNLQRINALFSSSYYFQLDNKIQQLIRLLVVEMRDNPDDLLLSRACNSTLIALLQRHVYSGRRHELRINMDSIDAYIAKHINVKISNAQLAGCVFLCESQFYALFKQQTGKTPHQYLLHKRFSLARELLENSLLSLSQIAEASGFANQSSFTHTFTKMQGISPSKYRK
ncbi:helix-turn-helix domain-containing protein [Psychromonas aquimarina]|uniref:helix-turn-helix domain-containing protein n=1 Tax=Psychromonas aquimarina TaxID=444919 RepID=UPI0003F8620B|nr:AraC family transcriptional regulator [Psychromonas aquimarina]